MIKMDPFIVYLVVAGLIFFGTLVYAGYENDPYVTTGGAFVGAFAYGGLWPLIVIVVGAYMIAMAPMALGRLIREIGED